MADLLVSKRARLDSTHPTRILARSMYKRLVSEGYDEREIVAFVNEIMTMLIASFGARGGSVPWVIALAALALIAHGCGDSGRGSCSALCANQATCPPSSAQSCITTCTQQESQCTKSNHAAEFQAFVDCASSLSTSPYACGNQGPHTTQCAEQALKLLECGVAGGGAPDSNAPDADATTPGNVTDRYIPFYDGGVAAVTPCYANQAFTEIPWAPPTSLHQDRCTAGQIATYINTLNGDGPFTSGSVSCDVCLQTDVGAASHGPLVTSSQGTMSAPIETNWGGCIANLDGMTAAAGCGNAFNNAGDCLVAECGGCNDSPSDGPTSEACAMLALGAGGRCATETTTTACAAEMETGGIAAACGPTLTSLLTIWCGP